MKMDMANFTIQQMRPFIQQQSVEYERLKFTEFLKTQEGESRLVLKISHQACFVKIIRVWLDNVRFYFDILDYF